MALLETRDLSVRFGGNLAVSGVDLDVEPWAITGLIGPNGAGKTTTFNMICGVLPPTEGRVFLDGKDVTRIGTHRRARSGNRTHLPAPRGVRIAHGARERAGRR